MNTTPLGVAETIAAATSGYTAIDQLFREAVRLRNERDRSEASMVVVRDEVAEITGCGSDKTIIEMVREALDRPRTSAPEVAYETGKAHGREDLARKIREAFGLADSSPIVDAIRFKIDSVADAAKRVREHEYDQLAARLAKVTSDAQKARGAAPFEHPTESAGAAFERGRAEGRLQVAREHGAEVAAITRSTPNTSYRVMIGNAIDRAVADAKKISEYLARLDRDAAVRVAKVEAERAFAAKLREALDTPAAAAVACEVPGCDDEDDDNDEDIFDEVRRRCRREPCDHGVKFATVMSELAKLSPGDIRARWPRLDGPCPRGCGFTGIAYASQAHLVMGGW